MFFCNFFFERTNVTGDKVGHSRKSKQTWWVGPTVACDVIREEVLSFIYYAYSKNDGRKK